MTPWRAFIGEPGATRIALFALLIHDTLIASVVLATTFLATQHDITDATVTAVFSATLGYAGGSSAARRQGVRRSDLPRTEGRSDG